MNNTLATLLSDSGSKMIEIVLKSIVVPICFFGLIGNCINISIFMEKEMRKTVINRFLMALSIFDLFILFTSVFLFPLPIYADMSDNAMFISVAYLSLLVVYPLALTAQTCSVYMTLVMSVFRYFGLSRPFSGVSMGETTAERTATFAVVIFSFLFNVPRWCELKLLEINLPSYDNKSVAYIVTLTDFALDSHYVLYYKVVIYTVAMFVVPFTTLIIVNTMLTRMLQKTSCERSRLTQEPRQSRLSQLRSPQTYSGVESCPKSNLLTTESSSRISLFSQVLNGNSNGIDQQFQTISKVRRNRKKERNTTIMLLVIVLIFLLCSTLPFINSVLEFLINREIIAPDSQAFKVSVDVGNLLVCINSSTNIIVYYIFSSKYRMLFRQRFLNRKFSTSSIQSNIKLLSPDLKSMRIHSKNRETAETGESGFRINSSELLKSRRISSPRGSTNALHYGGDEMGRKRIISLQ